MIAAHEIAWDLEHGPLDRSARLLPCADVPVCVRVDHLRVLAHQAAMTNHLTRLGWEARVAAATPSEDARARVREAAQDFVDLRGYAPALVV